MGLPWIQAPSEGEAQAAYITKKGDAHYCSSQDYDSLLFGAPKLLRNVTISGRRKRGRVYIEVVPEIIELNKVLGDCGLTYEQLIDVGILIGTDYNSKLEAKNSLKLIKQYGCIEQALPILWWIGSEIGLWQDWLWSNGNPDETGFDLFV